MTRDLPGIKIWALTAEPPLHNSFEQLVRMRWPQ
jgi:hypothetical protein